MIENVILKDQSLVHEWFLFCQDKRWTTAWALTDHEDGTWSVAHIEKDGKPRFVSLFTDPTRACALLVRMEMEDLRISEANQRLQPTRLPKRQPRG
jgi:hypothetical protein